jgi:hypothetical protein
LTALLPIFKLPAAAQNIIYGLVVLITVYLSNLSRGASQEAPGL